ncbi:TetR/AcrR family transcriptional regulator [Ponticaulis profundi]|uniref:TetR/AcrR family transcriptional regulator n=1 Tax=Ponticaulis profundi TaxID=2665222 RepID=A0ABW1S9B2_9PROT
MDTHEKSAKAEPRRQGPKRSEASRMAILSAAREELKEQGWRNFSPDRLSKRAKASKQTIYRWWPSVASIAVEAALEDIDLPAIDPKLDLAEQLQAFVEPIVDIARVGDGAHLLRSALLAAADDPQGGEIFRNWFNTNFRRPLKTVLAEAAIRGKIRKDWDIDSATEMLFGPVWHRMVMMRGPLTEVVAIRASSSLISALRL